MSVITKISHHSHCEAYFENKSCFDCSECLKQFCKAIVEVRHNCQGHLGKTEHIFELCEYCKERMESIRQLQVLRSGFIPILQREAKDFFLLGNNITFAYRGPHLSGLYVDHLCVPNVSAEDFEHRSIKRYLDCTVCIKLFKVMMRSDLFNPPHYCIDYSCNICSFILKYWAKLSAVSQICTKFIYDEHAKECNSRKELEENGVLRKSDLLESDIRNPFSTHSILAFSKARAKLDDLIEHRIKSKIPRPLSTDPLVVVVEGSIGAGKSSLLKFVRGLDSHSNLFEIYDEPIQEWMRFSEHGLFGKFYESPNEYSFAFQSLVMITKLSQLFTDSNRPVRLYERSFDSSFKCFLPTLEKLSLIKVHEADILKAWRTHLLNWLPQKLKIFDVLIYLRVDPTTCESRIKERGTMEESKISLQYLQILHSFYDSWVNDIRKNPFVRII
jgi:deoxyadenosine/deoxycytidine kinase